MNEFNKVEIIRKCCFSILPQMYWDRPTITEQIAKIIDALNKLIENNNKLEDYIKEIIQEVIESGEIETILKDMLANYILNVKYPPTGLTPATGNGTADDTTAIQGCINYAFSHGGMAVYFPSGSYLTQSIDLKNNVTLFGFDRENTKIVLKGGATRALINANVDNTGIQNLTLDGNMDIQVNNVNLIDITIHRGLFENLILNDGYILMNLNVSESAQINNIIFENAVTHGAFVMGTGIVQAENLIFNKVSVLNQQSAITVDVSNSNLNIFSKATITTPLIVHGNNNKICCTVLNNAGEAYSDYGINNNIIVNGVSSKLVFTKDISVTAKNSTENLSGNKSLTAVNLNENLSGNKNLTGVNSNENLSGNKTITAENIVLNPTQPLTYKTPEEFTEDYDFIPLKDASNTEYKVLVNKGLYGKSQKTTNTVDSLKQLPVKLNDVIKTLGYYNVNDGGAGIYLILNSVPSGMTMDNGSCIATNNGKYAILLTEYEFNTKQFGVFPDGEHALTDYTLSLQKCLDFAGFIKGKMIVCDGIYPCAGRGEIDKCLVIKSNTVLYLSNNTVLKFKEKYGRIDSFDGVTATPLYTGSHDILITGNGTIDGSGEETPTELWGYAKLRLGHSKNVRVENITFSNWNIYHACEIGGCDNVVFENVKFTGGSYTTTSDMEAVQFEFCNESNFTGAIPYDYTPSINITFKRCVFKASGSNRYINTAIGTHQFPDSNVQAYKNITIENCYFENNRMFSIILVDVDGCIIKDNTFLNTQYCAITTPYDRMSAWDWGYKNAIITGNKVIGGGDTDYTHNSPMITADKSENVNIVNNIIKNIKQGAFRVDGTSKNVNINSNSISDCNQALKDSPTIALNSSPIILYPGSNYVNVHSNIINCEDNTKIGMALNTGAEKHATLSVRNNQFIFGNAVDPVYFQFVQTNNSRILFSGLGFFGDLPLNDDLRNYDAIYVEYIMYKSGGQISNHVTLIRPTDNRDDIIDFSLTAYDGTKLITSKISVSNLKTGKFNITASKFNSIEWGVSSGVPAGLPTLASGSLTTNTATDYYLDVTRINGVMNLNITK